MSDLAVILGKGISVAHMAHAKHATGKDPQALVLYKGAPTTNPKLFGKGTSTLYVCAHATANSLAGEDEQSLLTRLFAVGLDSSKFGTIFLFACSTAVHVAEEQGFNGRTFAQEFYDLCQKSTAFKGMTVKAFLGVLHAEVEDGGFNRAPKVTSQCVILPNGDRKSLTEGMLTLSPAGGAYVPPTLH